MNVDCLKNQQCQIVNMSTKVLFRRFVFIVLSSVLFFLFVITMSDLGAQKSTCIFCNIVNHLEDTQILYEDDEVCCFRDIKPASSYHVLTVPKRHIEDVKALIPADKQLVDKMYAVAKELLVKNNLSVDEARFGYHWPPFRSVHHLHLHTIAPEAEMGYVARFIFMKNSYWFVSPEYVDKMLES